MVLSHVTIYFAVKRSSSFKCEKIYFLGIQLGVRMMSNQLAKAMIIAQTVTIIKTQLGCFDWPFDWCLWFFINALAHRQIFVINMINWAVYF